MRRMVLILVCSYLITIPGFTYAKEITVVKDPHAIVKTQANLYDQWLQEASFVGTALIVDNHQIILSKGYGYQDKEQRQLNSTQTHYQIGSIQKSWTAAMIAKLIEQKKLSFATPLSTFYPQIPHSQEVTIKQMLDMVSGLHLTKKPTDAKNETQVLDSYVQHTVYSHPGTFVYSPINYHLLAGIIQQLTHLSYWEALQQLILQPYAFHHVNYYTNWLTEPEHSTTYQSNGLSPYAKEIPFSQNTYLKELGTGNLDMTTEELYHFYTLFMNHQLFSEKIAHTFFQPLYKEAYVGGVYNYHTYFRSRGEIAQQQTLVLFTPDLKKVVILMSNERDDTQQMDLMSQLFSDLTKTSIVFK